MKLQDRVNRRVGNKEYRRWYLNLSKEEIEKLKWKKGQELESKVIENRLIIKPRFNH